MVAIAYTNDLTTITDAQTTTGWSAIGGGGAGLSADVDFAIQDVSGTLLGLTKQVSNSTKGMLFDNGSGITMGASDHVLTWIYAATPGILDSLANGGMRISIGTATSAYNDYYVAGNNTYQFGGQKNIAVRYSTSTPSPGSQTGTPGANPQWFGGQLATTQTSKAINLGIDVIRYGTGYYLTGGDTGGAGTFAGVAADNDTSTNQYGLFAGVAGGYLWKGRLVLGQNNSGTPTACTFTDATSANISIEDSPFAQTDFTQLIIDHASSVINITGMTIIALGTNDSGELNVNNSSSTVNLTGCRFVDFGPTSLEAGTTVVGCTWLRAGAITLNSATLDGCVIEDNTAASAVTTDDLDDITDTAFISDGTGHAVELTSIGAGTMGWDNTEPGSTYAATDGSTGNETIYVNVGSGTLDINVAAGASTPTIRTAGATVNVVSGQVTITVNVKNTSGTNIENARVLVETAAAGGEPFEDSVSIVQSAGTATVTHTGHGLATNDYVVIRGAQPDGYNKAAQITVTGANTYTYSVDSGLSSPATGSPVASFAPIVALTNASGNVTNTRSWGSDQALKGWARKGSSAPYYKTGTFTATVLAASGVNINLALVSDE